MVLVVDRVAKPILMPVLSQSLCREEEGPALSCLHHQSQSLRHALASSFRKDTMVVDMLHVLLYRWRCRGQGRDSSSSFVSFDSS